MENLGIDKKEINKQLKNLEKQLKLQVRIPFGQTPTEAPLESETELVKQGLEKLRQKFKAVEEKTKKELEIPKMTGKPAEIVEAYTQMFNSRTTDPHEIINAISKDNGLDVLDKISLIMKLMGIPEVYARIFTEAPGIKYDKIPGYKTMYNDIRTELLEGKSIPAPKGHVKKVLSKLNEMMNKQIDDIVNNPDIKQSVITGNIKEQASTRAAINFYKSYDKK